MAWRLARSLGTLRTQLNKQYPNRSKASDGTIGNAEHASRQSDHNPNAAGVVTAMDITHDPAHGVDIGALFNNIMGDSRIKYLIWDRRIWYPKSGWKNYKGTNPHTKHGHVSVSVLPSEYDDPREWTILGGGSTLPPGEHMRTAIPPATVSAYYKNFMGIDVPAGSGPTINRFEDTPDDEYFYGLCIQLRDTRIALQKENAELRSEVEKLIEIDKAEDMEFEKKEKAYKEVIDKLSKVEPTPVPEPEPNPDPDPITTPKRTLLEIILSWFRRSK